MTDPHRPVVDRPPATSRWLWLLPALTFLAGCALAGIVVGVGLDGDAGEESAGDGATAAATPSPGSADGDAAGDEEADGDVTVRVPRSCLEASESALVLAEQADSIAAAVRDLDARRLRELVDEVQQVRTEVRSSGEQCRRSAGEGLLDGSDASPTPSTSTS